MSWILPLVGFESGTWWSDMESANHPANRTLQVDSKDIGQGWSKSLLDRMFDGTFFCIVAKIFDLNQVKQVNSSYIIIQIS